MQNFVKSATTRMQFGRANGLGLIVQGVLLLGAQLILTFGLKNDVSFTGGEQRIAPAQRATRLPLFFGGISLVAGVLIFFNNKHRQAEEGRSVPGVSGKEESDARPRHSTGHKVCSIHSAFATGNTV